MTNKASYFLPSYKQCWVIVFILCVVGGLGIGLILELITYLLGESLEDVNPLFSYILPIIPSFIYIYFKGNQSYLQNGPKIKLSNSNFGKVPVFILLILLAISTIAIGYISEPLTSWLPMPDTMKKLLEQMVQNSVWSFITTAIAAPVIEEFLLRGIMERGLLAHTTPKNAILWSAFFFALIHLNPWQAIGAFIMGIFLGWIYWRTRSLWTCIFIHFVNNGFTFVLQLAYPNLEVDSTYQDLLNLYNPNLYFIIFVVLVISLISILYFLNKRLPKDEKVISY